MTRTQIQSVSPLSSPFCLDGDVVPPVDDPTLYANGFTYDYLTNGSSAPSKFVYRQTMNKILRQVSTYQFALQCGMISTFDENVCEAIGGYGKTSILQYFHDDVLYDVISLKNGNRFNFVKNGIDGVNWDYYGSSIFSYVYPDYGSTGVSNIIKTWSITESLNGLLHDGNYLDVLTIGESCFIQIYPQDILGAEGSTEYQAGVILFRGNYPENVPSSYDPKYTTYDLLETGSVNIPVIPVLKGTLICAFKTYNPNGDGNGNYTSGGHDYNICVRRLNSMRGGGS